MLANSLAPCLTPGADAAVSSLAGAFSDRMKLAKWWISSRLLSVGSGRLVGSVIFVGSGFGNVVATGGLQTVVTSGFWRLVVVSLSVQKTSTGKGSRRA